MGDGQREVAFYNKQASLNQRTKEPKISTTQLATRGLSSPFLIVVIIYYSLVLDLQTVVFKLAL